MGIFKAGREKEKEGEKRKEKGKKTPKVMRPIMFNEIWLRS